MKHFISSFFLLATLFLMPAHLDAAYKSAGNLEEIDYLNAEIEAKRDKIKKIEQSIASYKKEINQKRLEAVSLSNQLGIIENRMAQLELDIEATQQKREALELEVESLTLAIADKEEQIETQKNMVSELLRIMYFETEKNYLEVAAAHESFSEFYNQVQYIQTVERDLTKSVRGLKEAQESLTDKKTRQEERRDRYIALGLELEEKKVDLEEQNFAKSDLLAQTRASELTFQTMLTRLRSEYQAIENEISGIEREVRRRLAEKDAFNNFVSDDSVLLSWPTQSRYITARFHDPNYPYRHVFEHNAIDIRAAQGTALKAAASGYVAKARRCSSSQCYAYVMIVHANGISTVYGHMSNIMVNQDQYISRGDVIGYSGGTPGTVGAGPFVTGPHLHFEVRKNGIPVNPLEYLVRDY